MSCCNSSTSWLVHVSVSIPVGGRGEKTQDDVAALHAYDAAGGVQEVEVKVGITGHRAVEPRFEERGPLLLQDSLGAAQVGLAHAGHPGHHYLKEEPAVASWSNEGQKRGIQQEGNKTFSR